MANLYRKGDHDTRPWGTWEVLDGADDFCVKRIMVSPKSMLSLQLHHHRSEHWIIVKGEAFVTLNEKDSLFDIIFLNKIYGLVEISKNGKSLAMDKEGNVCYIKEKMFYLVCNV